MTRISLALALLLTACASGTEVPTDTTEVTTTEETTAEAVATEPAADSTIVIEATAGVDAGAEHEVPLGSSVRLVLVNEDDHDEFHLHGYDLVAMVEAGEEGVIEFVADTAGRFELESHESGDLILVLLVS